MLKGIARRWIVYATGSIAALLSVGPGIFSFRYLTGVSPIGPKMLANLFT